MNREEFAKRLYSTVIPEGTAPEDIQTLTRPVSETIREMMPKSLFRFRTCNELSVDAFQFRSRDGSLIRFGMAGGQVIGISKLIPQKFQFH